MQPTTNGITVTRMFHMVFFILEQGLSICLSFHFLLFSLWDPLKQQNLLDDKFTFLKSFLIYSFLFLFLSFVNWLLDYVIAMYLKIPEIFVIFILQKGFVYCLIWSKECLLNQERNNGEPAVQHNWLIVS